MRLAFRLDGGFETGVGVELPGIGPFYGQLVTIRGCGFADVLPVGEQHLLGLAGQLYGLGRPATDAELTEIALAWRPWRTWVSVLIRAAAPRILSPAGSGATPRRGAEQPAPLTSRRPGQERR